MTRTKYSLTAVRDRLGEHAYDAFLGEQPAGDFLQTLAWGRVKALTGWRSVPVLMQDYSGKVVLTCLLLVRNVPGLPVTMVYAPRGPVLDWDQPADQLEDLLRAFAVAARRVTSPLRSVLLKCDPALPAGNSAARTALVRAGFHGTSAGLDFEGLQPRFVYAISVVGSEAELLARFAPKHRYNIRLAGRKGVTVRAAADEADLAAFYAILTATAERDGFGIRSYSYYQAIWREVITTGAARLFLAEHSGQLLAGALIFVLGRHAWYVYGASANDGRNLMPNYALHWEIMRWCRQLGLETYDMRGMSGDMTPDNPLYGLYRFKKGFDGAVLEYAGEFDLPLARSLYWLTKAGVPAYRGLMRLLRRWRGRGAAPAAAPAAGDDGGHDGQLGQSAGQPEEQSPR